MKTAFEKLASPYLDGEMEFVVPAEELSTEACAYTRRKPLCEFPGFARGRDWRAGGRVGKPKCAGRTKRTRAHPRS